VWEYSRGVLGRIWDPVGLTDALVKRNRGRGHNAGSESGWRGDCGDAKAPVGARGSKSVGGAEGRGAAEEGAEAEGEGGGVRGRASGAGEDVRMRGVVRLYSAGAKWG